jgi:hypothetical protein
MVAGGYSHWTPEAVPLTKEQQARAAELKEQIATLDQQLQSIYAAIDKAVEGLDEAAADQKREELYKQKREELSGLSKQRQALHEEHDALVPGMKRKSFVWLYANTGARGKAAPPR